MARGGINKAHVLQARDALLARGINPSIDAVRTELGNTGSKSTIHRYLREIEDEAGARLDDAALLSDTLRDLVTRLAARLHEEAQAIVETAAHQHQAERQQWEATAANAKTALTSLQIEFAEITTALARERAAHAETGANWQQQTIQAERLAQQVSDLTERLREQETHRQSLEEKHQHARESLEHYRQSVKEQREQDQRRHEQQVQQLQAELRQVNQSQVVKQNEITQLNKDNARLISELSHAQKQAGTLRVDLQVAQDAVTTWRDKAMQQEAQMQASQQRHDEMQSELDAVKKQLGEQAEKAQQSAVALVKAEMHIVAQEQAIQALQKPVADAATPG